MSSQIGSTGQGSIQNTVIQNSVQQNAAKVAQRDAQPQQTVQKSSGGEENQNFQKLADKVLASRESGESSVKPSVERGQVVDLLV